jgi:hypothetical protein
VGFSEQRLGDFKESNPIAELAGRITWEKWRHSVTAQNGVCVTGESHKLCERAVHYLTPNWEVKSVESQVTCPNGTPSR